MGPFLNLSVVIITLNEEENLPRMLATMPPGVEVIVLDSGSTDRTQEIAVKAGAKFHTRPFSGYSTQKNAAMALATRGWVLSLDADEQPTQELWQEVLSIVSQDNKTTAWKISRRQIFLGKRLRFGKSGDAPIRLVPRGSGEFENAIHESFVPQKGVVVDSARSKLDHYSYRDITDYFNRFNRYTSSVASNHLKRESRLPGHVEQGARFFIEFFWRYVLRGGFLDGYPGFVFALLGSVYVFVKYAKFEEARLAGVE